MAHSVEIVQCHTLTGKSPSRTAPPTTGCTAASWSARRFRSGPGKLPKLEARLFKEASLERIAAWGERARKPALSLGYLVDLLRKQPEAEPLRAGEIITTGVLTDAHPVTPGETWHTEISGLPLKGLMITFR
jgi:2-keto-4-pentenoate hydratase